MILVDFNQVVISNLMVMGVGMDKIDKGLIHHMILNSLRSYKKKFGSKYGEMVICLDSRKYWRKDIFPHYKSHRKHDRKKSPFNWTFIFDTIVEISNNLKGVFPAKIIHVNGAEADDIIAVLAVKYSPSENVIIVSSDRDYLQLQKYNNISQYNPRTKTYMKCDDPNLFLKEHIIRGDTGDGIPNIKSPDNVFITPGKRQSPIRETFVKKCLEADIENDNGDSELVRNYKRNMMLIDFSCIPSYITKQICNEYDNAKKGTKRDLYKYLIANRMSSHLIDIDDFCIGG